MDKLQIRELSLEQAQALYNERLSADFSPDELRPFWTIERAFGNGQYVCYGAMDGEDILAYAFFLRLITDGHCWGLVDYFAVRNDLRGQNVGSRFIQALIGGPVRAMDCALLEIDDPDTATDAAARDTMTRRLRFYLRNGLVDTRVTAKTFGVDFRILALPAGGMPTEDEVRTVYGAIYREMLPEKLYKTMVKIK